MSAPVFLDACVLYPPLMRHLLIGAAAAGLYRPAWSARVLGEWHIAVAQKAGPGAALAVERAQVDLATGFPQARTEPDPAVEAAIALPDPADAHVLAGAVAAGAATILTLNLRDFPSRTLARHGVGARHPDGFLWELAGEAPALLAALIREGTAEADPARQRRALKRARLPRLGKAMAAPGAAGDGVPRRSPG